MLDRNEPGPGVCSFLAQRTIFDLQRGFLAGYLFCKNLNATGSIWSDPNGQRSSRFSMPINPSTACRVAASYSPVIAAVILLGLFGDALQLARDLLIDRHQRLRRRFAEVEMMQFQNLLQPLDRMGIIIHAQIEIAIVEARVAALLAHDQHRRALLPASITAGLLTGQQGRHQPIG